MLFPIMTIIRWQLNSVRLNCQFAVSMTKPPKIFAHKTLVMHCFLPILFAEQRNLKEGVNLKIRQKPHLMSSRFKLFFVTFWSKENVADAKSRLCIFARSPFSSTSLKIAFEAEDFEEVRFELLFLTNGWFFIHIFSTNDQSVFPASS